MGWGFAPPFVGVCVASCGGDWVSERVKTLVLKRAVCSAGVKVTLEDTFRKIFEKTSDPLERVMKLDLLRDAVIARLEQGPTNLGVFVRILEYEEGAIGSINFRTADGGADIEGVDPPLGQNFLQDDVGLFIVGNDVIACGMANKNRTYASQVYDLAVKLDILPADESISLEDVANQTNLRDLRKTGVREISLGVSDYLASLPQETDFGSRVLRAIWASPSDPEDVLRREARHGRLTLSRGRFKKDELKFDPWLTSVGEQIVEADDEEYVIILEDDRRLTNTNLKMVKKVRVKRHYNTVNWTELKGHLSQFFNDLRREEVV